MSQRIPLGPAGFGLHGPDIKPQPVSVRQSNKPWQAGGVHIKTMENEILREAVEYGRAKKWIAHSPSLPEDDQ